MCGRATLTVSVEEVAETLGALPLDGDLGPPKYNLAPSQPMLIVRPRRRDRARELSLAKWGLVPHWAKPDEAKSIAHRCVQARFETIAKAPAFRDAFRSRRCLVVVDGFYEWKTLPDGERIPFHVRRDDKKPFAIAGVWERWTSPDGEVVESCAVVTTKARGEIQSLHDRMPLVLAADAYDTWLTGSTEDAGHVHAVTPDLVVVPVSKHVNNPKNDDPRCIEPLV